MLAPMVLSVGFLRSTLFTLSLALFGCHGGSSQSGTDAGSEDGSPSTCAPGTVFCGGECIDPTRHREYCGATTCEDDATDGDVCGLDQACTGVGTCSAFLCEDLGPGDGTSCDLITSAGCESGEKCAEIIESVAPFVSRTSCVPNGAVPTGGECNQCEEGRTGYDNCSSGNSCFNGRCREICQSGPPDTCRSEGEPVSEGSYCMRPFGFDEVGVCISTCSPTETMTIEGAVLHNECAEDEGCYLNASRGTASCAAEVQEAESQTQNEDCFGPTFGGCYLNGCASGFDGLLSDRPEDPTGTHCARYCSPANAHSAEQSDVQGLSGQCETAALDLLGGTNGVAQEHQCRFVQSFSSDTELVSEGVGMCVPTTPAGGGSWGDCRAFDWDGLKAAWNAAIAAGGSTSDAFGEFCLEDPSSPDTSDIRARCLGYFRGCISLAEKAAGLPIP